MRVDYPHTDAAADRGTQDSSGGRTYVDRGNTVFGVGIGGGGTLDAVTIQSPAGNIDIGTMNPQALLDVTGNVKISGGGANLTFPDNTVQTTAWNGIACGGDYAGSVDVAGSRAKYEPGDVLVLTSEGSSGDVRKSQEAYSTTVAGIYATKPGITGRRQTGDLKESKTEVPMAMVGIVPTKVSAENGPIVRGDLLVTSSTSGYAMKGTDRSKMLGAVIGKAMGSLKDGRGMIEVLVTLQ